MITDKVLHLLAIALYFNIHSKYITFYFLVAPIFHSQKSDPRARIMKGVNNFRLEQVRGRVAENFPKFATYLEKFVS